MIAATAAKPNVPQTASLGALRHPIVGFLLRRLLAGVATLGIVSVLIFVATNVLPGNVAELVLGRNATPERLAALNVRLGLDASLPQRYVSWLWGLLHGDFGQSAVSVALNQPDSSISSTLVDPAWNSVVLAVITAALLVPLTLALGMLAGVRAGRLTDHLISLPGLVFGGLPGSSLERCSSTSSLVSWAGSRRSRP